MHPALNRAIQGQYPPGSVFKIIVAAAGLQEGSLTPVDRIVLQRASSTWATGRSRTGSRAGTATSICISAIAQSCNVFFYQAGLKVGGDRWPSTPQAFGLGAPTGIDLGGERFGLMPFSAAQRQRAKRPAGSPATP